MYLISPTERDAVELSDGDGLRSSMPEKYGSDFLILSSDIRCGIQRKKFPEDLLASVADGRLMRELMQMTELDMAFLVTEGLPSYTSDGHLVNADYSRWTRDGVENLLLSVRLLYGVHVLWSRDTRDTVRIVKQLEDYLRSGLHRSLLTRPKASVMKDSWGEFDAYKWGMFFLQGLPGIGPGKAEAIIKACSGVPLQWTINREDFLRIPGIDKGTAKRVLELVPTLDGQQQTTKPEETKPQTTPKNRATNRATRRKQQ